MAITNWKSRSGNSMYISWIELKKIIFIIVNSKIFLRFWLAWILKLSLHNQVALTKLIWKMFANINTIDVNHLDMDRKKDARPILTVQSCVSEVLLQEIFLNWKYMKWIIFWITDKNIKVYTLDSHIVIRSLKYDSFHYFNSCHFHYRVITSIVLISTKKKKKNGRGRCQKLCYRIRISFWIEMKWVLLNYG